MCNEARDGLNNFWSLKILPSARGLLLNLITAQKSLGEKTPGGQQFESNHLPPTACCAISTSLATSGRSFSQ